MSSLARPNDGMAEVMDCSVEDMGEVCYKQYKEVDEIL